MTIGSSVKEAVTSVINVIGSTVTITPYTKSSVDIGYSGQVETDGTTTTELAVPFNELVKNMKEPFGNLKTEDNELALKATVVIDVTGTTNYKITYRDSVYDIVDIDKFVLNDTRVAWIVKLSRRLD